jgi:hypothetical protein
MLEKFLCFSESSEAKKFETSCRKLDKLRKQLAKNPLGFPNQGALSSHLDGAISDLPKLKYILEGIEKELAKMAKNHNYRELIKILGPDPKSSDNSGSRALVEGTMSAASDDDIVVSDSIPPAETGLRERINNCMKLYLDSEESVMPLSGREDDENAPERDPTILAPRTDCSPLLSHQTRAASCPLLAVCG